MRSNKAKKGLDVKKRLRLTKQTILLLRNDALAVVDGGDGDRTQASTFTMVETC